jgi:integrase
VGGISELALDRFKANLIARNYAGRTINNAIASLRRVLRMARRWSKYLGFKVYLPDFSGSKVKERKHQRVVTRTEESLYAEACPTRLHLVYFKLLINTGIEPGYAAQARWEHVHFASDDDRPNGWIHDPCAKTETRPRDIPLTTELARVLREWWMEAGRPTYGWIFPSKIKKGEHRPLWSFHTTHKRIFGKSTHFKNGSATRPARGKGKRVFKHRWRDYGLSFKDGIRKGQAVPYFRLYDLRHTFLTRLGEEGVSEIELMHIAGWSSTRMAATYVHPSRRRLSRAIEKLDHAIAGG